LPFVTGPEGVLPRVSPQQVEEPKQLIPTSQ
jgi:hypothetical protein